MNNLSTKEVKKLRFFPLKILIGFLVFTELLFVFGPISYSSDNIGLTFTYLILNNVCLILGYYYYVTPLPKVYKINDSREQNNIRFLKQIICLTILLTPIRIKALWNINPFSVGSLVNHLIGGLYNPGDVYSSKLDLQSSLVTYINMFVNIFVILSLSAGIYYYKKLSQNWKTAVILLVIIELGMWIGQGVRKGLLDTFLLLFFITIAASPAIILNTKNLRKYIAISIIGIIIFISYFIFSNMSRYGLEDMTVLVEGNNMYSRVKTPYRSWNPIFLVTLCSIQGYACQGYYALSLAFSLPYEFSLFLGSSWFGINLSHRLGLDVFTHTYISRLESFGIDSTINWHSIYTWLANDYTFYFVPIITFFIGFFLAKSWNDTITNRSFFAPAIFFYFAVMVFYSFANNQVFSLMFIPFVITFFLWIIDRKKRITIK